MRPNVTPWPKTQSILTVGSNDGDVSRSDSAGTQPAASSSWISGEPGSELTSPASTAGGAGGSAAASASSCRRRVGVLDSRCCVWIEVTRTSAPDAVVSVVLRADRLCGPSP